MTPEHESLAGAVIVARADGGKANPQLSWVGHPTSGLSRTGRDCGSGHQENLDPGRLNDFCGSLVVTVGEEGALAECLAWRRCSGVGSLHAETTRQQFKPRKCGNAHRLRTVRVRPRASVCVCVCHISQKA